MPKKKTKKRATKKTVKKAVKKASSSHGPAQGKTQVSISLAEDLVAKIDALAATQNRNRSNFIATALETVADQDG